MKISSTVVMIEKCIDVDVVFKKEEMRFGCRAIDGELNSCSTSNKYYLSLPEKTKKQILLKIKKHIECQSSQ